VLSYSTTMCAQLLYHHHLLLPCPPFPQCTVPKAATHLEGLAMRQLVCKPCGLMPRPPLCPPLPPHPTVIGGLQAPTCPKV
jgi:hypothetical protein